jgi:hypothetical protein
MTEQRHGSTAGVPDFPAREPSIPEPHDSIELTDDAIVIYDETDSQRWVWTDEAVRLAALR